MTSSTEEIYRRQGFGGPLKIVGPHALLLIDFCNAFADESQLGGGNILGAAQRSLVLLDEARARAWPIAHSQIVFNEDGSDENAWFEKVPALRALTHSSPAAAFMPELAPKTGELIIRKTVPSAFFGAALTTWLIHHRVQTVVIAGCTTSGCVRASAVDAISLGFRPIIVTDCVGDRAISAHEASLADLHAKYADVLHSNAILDLIDGRRQSEPITPY